MSALDSAVIKSKSFCYKHAKNKFHMKMDQENMNNSRNVPEEQLSGLTLL